MSEFGPIYGIMLTVMCFSVIPAAIVSWFWGGRGVFYVCVSLGLLTVAFLTWFAFTASFSTGLESLVFIIWPLFYLAACVGAFVGYATIRILKPK